MMCYKWLCFSLLLVTLSSKITQLQTIFGNIITYHKFQQDKPTDILVMQGNSLKIYEYQQITEKYSQLCHYEFKVKTDINIYEAISIPYMGEEEHLFALKCGYLQSQQLQWISIISISFQQEQCSIRQVQGETIVNVGFNPKMFRNRQAIIFSDKDLNSYRLTVQQQQEKITYKTQREQQFDKIVTVLRSDVTGDCSPQTIAINSDGILLLNGKQILTISHSYGEVLNMDIKDLDRDNDRDILVLTTRTVLLLINPINSVGTICSEGEQPIFEIQIILDKLEITNGIILLQDYNLDGYPDLVINYQSNNQNGAYLFTNILCSNCEGSFLRTFIKSQQNLISDNWNQVQQIAFVDFGDDTSFDMAVTQIVGLQKQTKFLNISPPKLANCFIKITFSDEYFQSLETPAVSFLISSLSGELTPLHETINEKSRFNLPYTFFGLGKTNNHIQSFTTYILVQDSYKDKNWYEVIPNSQVQVIQTSQQVKLQVRITPTKLINMAIIGLIIVLCVLGYTIMKLTKAEKLLDQQNQQRFFAILR